MSKGGVTTKRRACSLAKSCISFVNKKRKSIFDFLTTLNTETVPYVSIAYLNKKPSNIDPARFSGLSHIHVIATDAGVFTLISYWKTRDRFERFGQDLYDSLGTMPSVEGLVGLAAKPPKPWYTIFTLSRLIALGAVLTALITNWGNLDTLFGTPMVQFERVSKEENYLNNQPFTIDCQARNVGSCKAKIDHIKRRIRPSSGIRLISEDPKVGEIPPNQLSEIHITAQGLAPGAYEIHYSGRLSNGFFNRRRWEGLDLKVNIWKDCEAVKSENFRLIDPKNCEIEGPGKGSRLKIQVTEHSS